MIPATSSATRNVARTQQGPRTLRENFLVNRISLSEERIELGVSDLELNVFVLPPIFLLLLVLHIGLLVPLTPLVLGLLTFFLSLIISTRLVSTPAFITVSLGCTTLVCSSLTFLLGSTTLVSSSLTFLLGYATI